MILYGLLLLVTVVTCQFSDYAIQPCGPNTQTSYRKRPRVAFISHDSAISTFFHNPEQGSRDAANIVNVDIEWNRYMTTSEEDMHQDILHAVDDHVDGIICSIPNQITFEAVQYALSKKVPVVVFNSGLKYASELGLTRVLQSNLEAGLMMGENLAKANVSNPLAIRMASMEMGASGLRLRGISQSMGNAVPSITEIQDDYILSNTYSPVQTIVDTFINGNYDSLISMGGDICADLVATAALEIRERIPERRLVTGFFDVGGHNMTTLFRTDSNTFGITQLPYFQTALPVFLMHLRLMTGHDVYQNKTINTGPNLVTNATLNIMLQSEQNSLLNLNEKIGSIGTLIPNTRGDTYNAAMMAGIVSLGHKLNWTVTNAMEDGPIANPTKAEKEFDKFLASSLTNGIIVQTSNVSLLDYMSDKSIKAPEVGISGLGYFYERYNRSYPHITNIGIDYESLARSVADALQEDNKLKPVCISERINFLVASPFCTYFYQAYQAQFGNHNVPQFEHVVQSINVSFPGAMESEFAKIMRTLQLDNYEPDSYIVFSENVFTIVNNRVLKGHLSKDIALYTGSELYDQNQAFLEGRVKGIWAPNMFSIGFMTLLHVAMDKVVTNFPSWEGALISVPRVNALCEPGTYHTNFTSNAYCQDNEGNIQKSLRCIQCPENMYSSLPNQDSCQACSEGYYAPAGSSSCISCFNYSDKNARVKSEYCFAYISGQEAYYRKLFLAIFVPIGIVVVFLLIGALIWFFRKRFRRQRALGSDETWLLHYDDLVKPDEGIGNDIMTGGHERTLVNGSTSSFSQRAPVTGQEDPSLNRLSANSQFNNNHKKKGSTVSAEPITGIKLHQDNARLIHALGFHQNLPVYIRQIGFKKVRVDGQVRKEVQDMKNARHPKLIEFVGLILEPNRTFIVEEYCTKGSLADVLENPDIELAWIFRFSLINDLISGMRFLHRSKFVHHGCLTSSNCMITGRWELKIIDYGLERIKASQNNEELLWLATQHARVLTDTSALLWLAPESIIATPQSTYLTLPSQPADVYSVGVVINEILTRERPYHAFRQQPQVIFNLICEKNLRPRMMPLGSDEFTDGVNEIVRNCLQVEPSVRPSFDTMASRLETLDPYFCGSDSVVDNMAILLEKYANDMENLVKKRTFNLQQRTLELEEERARTETLMKDLKTAKEVAEAAAASKQNFLANMSHEIRTPMNAVIGMSRTLMESDLPPDLYDCAETIETSGNHLMALIDDILDYSKIDSGKLTLEKSMLDLTYVVESAMKLIATNYLSKGLGLWYTISPDLPVHVYGDLVRLRQILLNLLSNAFKFTSTGYVSVSVELYQHQRTRSITDSDDSESLAEDVKAAMSSYSREDDEVTINPMEKIEYLFSVKDTGIGIPKSKSNKLFKSFSQVDASTTRNFGGTGLGLAISKKLSRIMGGDMWVESEEGQGSTFYFNVTLEKQPDSETYGLENRFKEICTACPDPIVVAERDMIHLKWTQLLNNLGMPNPKCFKYHEASTFFRNKNNACSLIIVDMDFDKIEEGITTPCIATSQSVLKQLIQDHPHIVTVPSLCIIDNRMKRSRRVVSAELEANFSSSAILHPQGSRDPIPTPQDEPLNPFDANNVPNSPSTALLFESTESAFKDQAHETITKPFKNSRLIGILHELLLASKSLSRRGSEHSPATNNSDEESDRNSNYDLASIKTLVVDDNPVNVKVLSRMLSQIGITVTSANNGREAFEKVKAAAEANEPYDLVFMDIWMPELNGLEASQKIRQHVSAHSPYIIALTACVMPGDRAKCMEAGMNGYVSKPIRKEELEASIHTFTQSATEVKKTS